MTPKKPDIPYYKTRQNTLMKGNRTGSYRKYTATPCVLLILFMLTACEQKNSYIEPPPPQVTVSKALQKTVTDYLEFTGTTQATGYVEVKARVSGILQSMHFEPGTKVEEGELLFVIDPRPYQAELDAAKAELASARAEYHRTEAELERADQLIKKNFISKTDHLRRQTERDVAQAAIGRMQAKVEIARIKLEYTQVTAPISGRVGRNLVDIGNLVGEGEATLLTDVTQFSPMYAYFHLNERDLLQIMQVHREETKQKHHDSEESPTSDLEIPVYLGLTNETGFPYQGVLDFANSVVNTETGTMELRAIFPNLEKPPNLISGLFARLRFPVGIQDNALLVSERALAADQGGQYLLLVNSEDRVEKRPVSTGQVVDGLIVINKGIQADHRIIINGLQRARPGAKVNPQLVDIQSASAPNDQTDKIKQR